VCDYIIRLHTKLPTPFFLSLHHHPAAYEMLYRRSLAVVTLSAMFSKIIHSNITATLHNTQPDSQFSEDYFVAALEDFEIKVTQKATELLQSTRPQCCPNPPADHFATWLHPTIVTVLNAIMRRDIGQEERLLSCVSLLP
jgi:hypothetical protein